MSNQNKGKQGSSNNRNNNKSKNSQQKSKQYNSNKSKNKQHNKNNSQLKSAPNKPQQSKVQSQGIKQAVPETNLFSMDLATQLAKEVNEKSVYTLQDGNDLEFYGIFPESIIQDVLIEAQDIARQVAELDIKLTNDQFNDHILFLCIKHFTHLKDQLSDEYLEQVAQYKHLIDIGFVREVIKDVFLPEEIQKVFDRFGELQSQLELIIFTQNKTKEMSDETKIKQEKILNDLNNIRNQKRTANKTK